MDLGAELIILFKVEQENLASDVWVEMLYWCLGKQFFLGQKGSDGAQREMR